VLHKGRSMQPRRSAAYVARTRGIVGSDLFPCENELDRYVALLRRRGHPLEEDEEELQQSQRHRVDGLPDKVPNSQDGALPPTTVFFHLGFYIFRPLAMRRGPSGAHRPSMGSGRLKENTMTSSNAGALVRGKPGGGAGGMSLRSVTAQPANCSVHAGQSVSDNMFSF